jgi:hypothetical protein
MFTQVVSASGTHWIGYRMGTKLGLDSVEVGGCKSFVRLAFAA